MVMFVRKRLNYEETAHAGPMVKSFTLAVMSLPRVSRPRLASSNVGIVLPGAAYHFTKSRGARAEYNLQPITTYTNNLLQYFSSM